ncbi:Putative transport protein [uncultured Candidatus Thioglobus sp.]|nr:Putative transport protein [uncultured Candidatus Thioglobus sp.]
MKTLKMQNNYEMTGTELQDCLSLMGIIFMRMFGLFIILPVFSLYARTLEGSTSMLIGLAFGIYGLTQALLQIPFGMLSDKFGRKPVIFLGLLIFAIGGLIASSADSIWIMLCGRAIQGAGAVSATLMALVADVTRVQHRTKAMALIGASIGAAFGLAFICGPILNATIGGDGIFLLGVGLAILSIGTLYFFVSNPADSDLNPHAVSWETLRNTFADTQIVHLSLGIFILHAILMANFIVLPISMQDHASLALNHHWKIYLPVLLASVALMVYLITREKKKQTLGRYYKLAVILLLLSQISYFFWHSTLIALAIGLLVFFTAFNYLEASIPSLISILAKKNTRGGTLGVYATFQFSGIFAGGLIGGIIHEYAELPSVFVFGIIMAVLWLLLVMSKANDMQITIKKITE